MPEDHKIEFDPESDNESVIAYVSAKGSLGNQSARVFNEERKGNELVGERRDYEGFSGGQEKKTDREVMKEEVIQGEEEKRQKEKKERVKRALEVIRAEME